MRKIGIQQASRTLPSDSGEQRSCPKYARGPLRRRRAKGKIGGNRRHFPDPFDSRRSAVFLGATPVRLHNFTFPVRKTYR